MRRCSSEGCQGAWEAVDLVLLGQVRLLLASGGRAGAVRLEWQCSGGSGGLSGEVEAAAQEPWWRGSPAVGRGGGHGGWVTGSSTSLSLDWL